MKTKHLTLVLIPIALVVIIGAGLVLLASGRHRPPLQRGTSLVFEIHADDEVSAELIGQIATIIEELLDPTGRMRVEVNACGQRRIEVRIPPVSPDVAAARDAYGQALDAITEADCVTQLSSILTNYVPHREAKALSRDLVGREELRRRRERLQTGLADLLLQQPARAAEVQEAVERHKAWADLRYGLLDEVAVRRLIRRGGVLEFRIAPLAPTPQVPTGVNVISADKSGRYARLLQEFGPEEVKKRMMPYVWLPIRDRDDVAGNLVMGNYASQLYVLLHNTPGNTMLYQQPGRGGWQVTDAREAYDHNNLPAVAFQLNTAGAERMALLTSAHQAQYLAIILDDVVYNVPRIQEGAVIRDRGLITVGGDPREAFDLMMTLNMGGLLARINPEPVSISEFGPGLHD